MANNIVRFSQDLLLRIARDFQEGLIRIGNVALQVGLADNDFVFGSGLPSQDDCDIRNAAISRGLDFGGSGKATAHQLDA
jgi:hypothetical protein